MHQCWLLYLFHNVIYDYGEQNIDQPINPDATPIRILLSEITHTKFNLS